MLMYSEASGIQEVRDSRLETRANSASRLVFILQLLERQIIRFAQDDMLTERSADSLTFPSCADTFKISVA
jgi:hypothetical protein